MRAILTLVFLITPFSNGYFEVTNYGVCSHLCIDKGYYYFCNGKRDAGVCCYPSDETLEYTIKECDQGGVYSVG